MKKILAVTVTCALLINIFFGAVSFSDERFKFIRINYDGPLTDGFSFSEDLAAVCDNTGKMGYIDINGDVAIPFEFEFANSFSEGLAAAAVPNGKYGFIGKAGKFKIPPSFDFATKFSQGLCLVISGGRWFYIDKTGREVIIAKDSTVTGATDFSDGVAWMVNQNGDAAIVDIYGQMVCDFRFKWYSEFSEGVAWAACDVGNEFAHFQMGLIDKNGNWVIQPGRFTDARPFKDGVAWVRDAITKQRLLIDKSGNILLRYGTEQVCDFDGGISVTDADGGVVFIDKNDYPLWRSKNYSPCFYNGYGQGRVIVKSKSDGRFYIIEDAFYKKNAAGQENRINFSYADSGSFNYYGICLLLGSPVAIVNNEWCYIDPLNLSVMPEIIDNTAMIPLDFIAKYATEWEVGYNPESDTVLYNKDKSISFNIDDTAVNVKEYDSSAGWYSEKTIKLSSPPILKGGHIYLPVRSVAELMGLYVFWYEPGLIVLKSINSSLTSDRVQEILNRYK